MQVKFNTHEYMCQFQLSDKYLMVILIWEEMDFNTIIWYNIFY